MLNLTSLTLEALRGATQPFELKFESGKKITIVYGENGSGKSTVCDALDLLGNDGLSSLAGKGLSTTTKYWHSTNRKPADIKVTLAAKTEGWTAQVIKGKVVVAPAENRPKVAILRRHQILSLIAGRAGDRYQALRPFIAIDPIDESERSLRDLINGTRKQRDLVEARIGENLQTLENVWKQANSPAPIMEWADAEAKRDTSEISRSIAAIQNHLKLHQNLDSRTNDLETSLARENSARVSLAVTEAELTEAVAGVAVGSEELTQLFQSASHYFQRHDRPEACPLCESREFAATLPQTVESKLRALASVRAALGKKETAQRSVDGAESQSRTALAHATKAADAIIEACSSKWHSDLPSTAPIIQVSEKRKAASVEPGWSLEELHSLSELVTTLATTLQPELARREQRKSLLQTVRDALDQYQHNVKQKGELDSLLPRLEKAHEVFVEERRAFVDEILGRIATRVGELYEEVHPGEGLSKISLQLDPKQRASLEVVSQFPGAKDSPPGAYLSESHLDTLGVCIFLALAGEETPENTILVLDDVVASVDEPHVDRIIEMVYDVSQRFAHCLLTTHYRPWREKFRWGYLQKGECQFVELGEWSWVDGIVTSKSTPRIDRLQVHLAEALPEPSDVCACAGVILEALLDFLTLRYECAVPRRRTKPTLGDLLPAMNKKLRAALRVEVHDSPLAVGAAAPTVQLGSILDKLQKLAQLRNLMGCHFNEIAFHLSGKDGIEFGQLVLELARAVVHPDHGWPASDKSGEYWTNSGKSRRLYPLKQPA